MSRTVIDVNRDPPGARSIRGRRRPSCARPTTLRRRAALSPGRSPTTPRSPAPRDLFRPLSRRARGRDRAAARVVSARVVLYDAHSIRSRVPRLFDGELPRVQHRHQRRRHLRSRAGQRGDRSSVPRAAISHVVNGRFKGGWTTRHYGRPESGIHAIQMELACAAISTSRDAARPRQLAGALRSRPRRADAADAPARCSTACIDFART